MNALASSSIWLAFAFGLRHGLEADHIVVVDALTLRASIARERWAPWIGAFFALGHGMTVLVVSTLMLSASSARMLSDSFLNTVSWLPIVILSVLGLSNLLGLLRTGSYRLISWKQRLLPRQLRDSSNPWVIAAIGVIFALVIDSFVQGAVLASMALARGGVMQGLILGSVFMAGMIVSETADSHFVFRAIGSSDASQLPRRQRTVGWVIVILSFATVAYALAGKFNWHPIDDASSAVLGGMTIALLGMIWLLLRRAERARSNAANRAVRR